MVFGAVLAASLSLTQSAALAPAECVPSHPAPSISQICLAEAASKRAQSAPPGSAERMRELDTPADHYRRASDIGTSDIQLRALIGLAQVFDTAGLNEPGRREGVLRELMALVPGNPRFAFDLAALQELQGFIEASEDTLLITRQAHAANIEVYRRLAQFYARRVTSLTAASREQQPPPAPGPPLQRDADGVYRLGSGLPPPRRMGVAVYPEDAKAAGISGAVQTEIVIDEAGRVVDAKVIRSVPLLDEAALNAVREWQFQPAAFNGKPIPIRMTVTVQFTP